MAPLSLYAFISLMIFGLARADVKPYIATAAEYNTECKTCPRSLCPNQAVYAGGDTLNATCWTRGTKIMGDRLWLKSEAGCYVTQYDVLEYAGDCELRLNANKVDSGLMATQILLI